MKNKSLVNKIIFISLLCINICFLMFFAVSGILAMAKVLIFNNYHFILFLIILILNLICLLYYLIILLLNVKRIKNKKKKNT